MTGIYKEYRGGVNMKNLFYESSKSNFSEADKEKLRKEGFTNFYEIMNECEEEDFRIVDSAPYNNVGCIATNFEIKFNREDELMEMRFMYYDVFMNRYKPKEFNFKEV